MSSLPPETLLSDEQLVRDTLAGRNEAFGELMRKHQSLVMDLALRMLRNREEAEDVIQQVFVAAYRHLADFRFGSQFSTWLYAIALNRARNHLRSKKTRRLVAMDDRTSDGESQAAFQLPDTTPQPDEIVEKQFNLDWIHNQMQSLSEEYQTIFTLHYFQNIPLQEIAQRLHRPVGTVKVYLHRARKELFNRWTAQNRGGPSNENAEL